MERKNEEYYTIDILHIVKTLWHRAWLIVLCGILFAGAGFSVAKFLVKPTYSSSVMLYVNNGTGSGNPTFNISSSQIVAAQELVKTYGEFLSNRESMEQVIREADLSYEYEELSKMIKSAPSNGTEVMKVTVVAKDPEEAALIANTASAVLQDRIGDIIPGATVAIVSRAVPEYKKVGPSGLKYTAVGLCLGVLLMVGLITLHAVMDDRIHDEEYVLEHCGYPVLAKIPDLVNAKGRRYGYYYYRHRDDSGE